MPVYETDSDRDRELEIAREIESLYECVLERNEKLDHIDFTATWSNGRISNVEIRNRPGMTWGQYPTVYMSAIKFGHATQLMRQNQSFSFFVKTGDGGLYKWTAKPEHVHLLGNIWDGKSARTIVDPQWLITIPIGLFVEAK